MHSPKVCTEIKPGIISRISLIILLNTLVTVTVTVLLVQVLQDYGLLDIMTNITFPPKH